MVHRSSPFEGLSPREIMRREQEEATRQPAWLPTGTQTVGPYFHFGMVERGDVPLIRGDNLPPGQRIRLTGAVLDGAGAPINDALLEIWQADGRGRFHTERAEPDFDGFGRFATDADGAFTIDTLKPGVSDDALPAAPHLDVHLFARGVLHTLFTRIYFDDEHNQHDPLLAQVPEERRDTLIARRSTTSSEDVVTYHFNFYMQGAAETVFLIEQE
ncbi:protocatechuate 3,4-dioxygenase alpha subunit [Kushneria sinocarnis]|uniref:Protocatechuate 3,4-dioxygenase alpha subunit n=1 Tax=Kushneria sinocarnis TaxID=595502 RepID=A0A420WWF5_9GAMM|nr:protocatechuate 3,4-dioxygenase subunit alpha [Kushneria sinocarnis]RKR03423.1 protocatechuate 3,4-dioxygenase alpha subunit [Kushneria sinocarnis]